jgi:hypothetical protein
MFSCVYNPNLQVMYSPRCRDVHFFARTEVFAGALRGKEVFSGGSRDKEHATGKWCNKTNVIYGAPCVISCPRTERCANCCITQPAAAGNSLVLSLKHHIFCTTATLSALFCLENWCRSSDLWVGNKRRNRWSMFLGLRRTKLTRKRVGGFRMNPPFAD